LEGGKEGVPDDLQIFFKTVATIPISNSECERNFSSINEIITPLRSSLNISTVSALLFDKCVDHLLTGLFPEKYVPTLMVSQRSTFCLRLSGKSQT